MTVRERLSSSNETRSGGWDDDTQWNERAAFRIAVESREVSEGRLVWRTRAYHEEHDQRRVWTGVPDEALIEWIHDQLQQSIGDAVPAPVRHLPESAKPAAPASAVPPDDLQQIPGIGPAIARRLHAAGITTFAALAACSPSDLASWTGRSADQITRMGWIERARELAHPAPPAAPAPEPMPVATPVAAVEAPLPVEAPVAEPGETLVAPVTGEAPLAEAVEVEPATVMEGLLSGEEAEHPPVMEAPTEATIVEPLAAETPAFEAARVEPLAAMEALPAKEAEPQPAMEAPMVEMVEAESLAATEAPPSVEEESREAQEMMLEESPIVFAAILLDEEGDVQDIRLTTTGEQPPEWNDRQVARFFIETGAPIPHEAVSVSLHLSDVQIDTIPARSGKGAPSRLHATASVRFEGAEALGERSASCHVVLLAYDLAAGETHVLSTTNIECTADALEVPVTLDADLPEVGRYQLLMAALMPEGRALSAVSGPRLRVTP
ncbi:MAG: helix-hairpin-helix domain-containing protein [Roseiflexaceae bacterium]|nr:helix-hairpin-helix domain-containing protein [Roseiflexus sp.]MDW8214299.1 helix-hairpin-helix domain-containing protein [Roseiflexaceae bacterium]